MKVRTPWKKCPSCGVEHRMMEERCMLCCGPLKTVFVEHQE